MAFRVPEEGPRSDHLDEMTAVQLKALCKEQGLKVSGKKDELKDRLREHFLANAAPQPTDELDAMSDKELVQSLVARGLDSSGDRATMLERLREDIKFIHELENAIPPDMAQGYRTIGEALEAAARNGGAMEGILSDLKAKAGKKSKYLDITIKSLGMTPEKSTQNGAPSVTADVLRSLAGDPFENPPKYGSVRKNTRATMDSAMIHCYIFLTILCLGSTRRTSFLKRVKKDTKPALRCIVYMPLAPLIL